MAIQRVSGNILQDNLQRGANLSIQGNLAYFDVVNNRVGILTSTPSDELEVVGTANASNVRITSATANGIFYAGNTLLALTSSNFTYDGVNVFISGNLQATGNIEGGNIISDGAVVGNIDVGNITVSGNISVESLAANLFVTAVGNITGGNIISNADVSGVTLDITANAAVGNILTDGYYYANGAPVDFQQPAGANTEIQYNFNSDFGASANLTYDQATNIFQVGYGNSGTIQTDTLAVTESITGNDITSQGNLQVNGDAIVDGNLTINGDLVYNNVTSLNIEDPIISMGRGANNTPLVSNDGKDRGEQLWYYSGSEKSAFIGLDNSAGNLIAAVDVSIANEIVTVNQYGTWQIGNLYGQSVLITGNVDAANVSSTGNISAIGNVIAGNVISSGAVIGNVEISGNLVVANLTVTDLFQGNVVSISNTISALGNITSGNLISNSSVSAGTTISATGNITSGNLISNAAISAATTISATGNVTGGNVVSNAAISASTEIFANGNITGGNIISNGFASIATTVSAGGNITGGNIVSNASISAATTISATGNITGGNLISNALISAATTISATGNITGGNLISNARIVATTLDIYGDALVAGNLTVQGNLTYINIDDLRVEDPVIQLGGGANGNALVTNDGKDRGTLLTYYTTSPGNAFVGWDNSSGNMIIANDVAIANDIITVNAFGTLEAGNIYAESAVVAGNVSFGNISTSGQISATGNITGGNLVSNANISASNAIFATGNIIGGNLVSNANISAASFIFATGNITGGNLVSNANISASNAIFATGNITGGNLVSNANISASNAIFATGNITGGNLVSNANISAASFIFATGNITGGNLVSNANISANNTVFANVNIIGGNLISNGFVSVTTTVSATGNITGGNLVSNANISATNAIFATGNITGGNLVSNALITGANVQVSTLTTNRIVYVGTDDYLVDSANFMFNGSNANLQGQMIVDNITIDGTTITSNANLSITSSTGNILLTPGSAGVTQISSTTALTVPVGNTAQRPAGPDQGAIRFNSTNLVLEVWDGTQWDVVGQDLAILTSQVINGDGTTVAFTLDEDTTSSGILVSINGVSQIPDVSYGVTGNVITFTEAPQVSDAVEVRFLTQVQTVTEITNTSGNASVGVSATASQVNVIGNLLPSANVTYDLGSTNLRWRDGYFSGNSITLGNIILKNTTGNTLAFFGPDGTTPGTLSSTNVDTTTIANGTSNVQTLSSGTVTISAGGNANVVTVTNGSATFKADILNGQANGVGNIGSSSTYFNTVFAKATSAQYADLAEYFACDQQYDTGTVMVFGGTAEVTKSTEYADQSLAGIVSTDPAFTMNSTQPDSLPIAMAGRVPCWVVGPVNRGDVLTTSSQPGHAEKLQNQDWKPGVIVGKALESAPAGRHKIMVVVGAW